MSCVPLCYFKYCIKNIINDWLKLSFLIFTFRYFAVHSRNLCPFQFKVGDIIRSSIGYDLRFENIPTVELKKHIFEKWNIALLYIIHLEQNHYLSEVFQHHIYQDYDLVLCLCPITSFVLHRYNQCTTNYDHNEINHFFLSLLSALRWSLLPWRPG